MHAAAGRGRAPSADFEARRLTWHGHLGSGISISWIKFYLRGILLGLLVAWTAAPIAFGQIASMTQIILRGDSSYQAFDNALALRFYQAAFQSDSSRYDILLRMARTQYDYGLDRMAEGSIEAARELFEDSIRHAKVLAKLYPDSAQSFILLAATTGNMALFTGGREKVLLGREVERYSQRAITLDSTLSYSYVALGIYYREVNRLTWFERMFASMLFGPLPETDADEVLSLLLRAERLRPEFPFLQYELAMTYREMGRFEEAIQHLQRLQLLPAETTQDLRNQHNSTRIIAELRRKAEAGG